MNLPEKGLWALVWDTSAVFAWVNRLDPDHGWVKGQVARFSGPPVLPAAILAEVGYLLEKRLGLDPLLRLLEELEEGFFLAHWDAKALSCAHRILSAGTFPWAWPMSWWRLPDSFGGPWG